MSPILRKLLIFVGLAGVALLIGGAVTGAIGGVGSSARAPDPSVARVVRVIDGDTIQVRYVSGFVGLVRYIGIDAPETGPTPPAGCYGREAALANERLVAGERVQLIQDKRRMDPGGHLLAYVHRVRDDMFVNAALLRGGYATVLTVPPNVARVPRFLAADDEARAAHRGLWRACNAAIP